MRPDKCLGEDKEYSEDEDDVNRGADRGEEFAADANEMNRLPTSSKLRPVYVPEWFRRLDNQIVVRGGSDLNYNMGVPINEYGERMNVAVDFGDLSNATFYEPPNNQMIVEQKRLGLNETGY